MEALDAAEDFPQHEAGLGWGDATLDQRGIQRAQQIEPENWRPQGRGLRGLKWLQGGP